MIDSLIRISPTSTYWAAWVTIASTAALFIFFGGVGFMGPVNDLLSVFQFLLFIPAVLALYRILGPSNPGLSGLFSILAIIAMMTIALLQTALVLGTVNFEQTLRPILALGVLLGAWWMVVGQLSLSSGLFPDRLAWLALATGFFYILIAVGFWISGSPDHPLAAIGFLVSAITLPWWAFWLSGLLGEMLT